MKESKVEQGYHTYKVWKHEEHVQMQNAIQRRCYTSQVPAVQAATSSVLADRCAAKHQQSQPNKRLLSSDISKKKSEGAPVRRKFAESRFVRSISCNEKMRPSPIIYPLI